MEWWMYLVGSILVPIVVQMLRKWRVADQWKAGVAFGVSVLVTVVGMLLEGRLDSWAAFVQDLAIVFAAATVFYRTVLKPAMEKGMLMKIIAPMLLVALLAGCQGIPGGGSQSPGTAGAPAVATAVQGAQTIGRDQGQAETPQTVTTGTAGLYWYFAAQADPGTLATIVALAREKNWTPEQLTDVLISMNGAPENVTITTGSNTVQSGAGDQAGSSGGTGGSTIAPPSPARP